MGVSSQWRGLARKAAGAGFSAVLAALPVSGAEKITEVIDSAGGAVSSAAYRETGSLGGVTGVSDSPSFSDRGGYTAQLSETTDLQVNSPQYMDEGTTLLLRVLANQDDGTSTALTGSEVSWQVFRNPENASVSPAGNVQAAIAYQESATVMQVGYAGVTGQVTVVIRDIDTDNFGLYTGDGLPDFWQVRYFGINDPLAAPGQDPDGDGKDNRNEYLARTHPRNAASVFNATLTGDPDHLRLEFPTAPDRHYHLESSPTMAPGSWTILSGPLAGTGGPLSFPITPSPGPSLFYRVSVVP